MPKACPGMAALTAPSIRCSAACSAPSRAPRGSSTCTARTRTHTRTRAHTHTHTHTNTHTHAWLRRRRWRGSACLSGCCAAHAADTTRRDCALAPTCSSCSSCWRLVSSRHRPVSAHSTQMRPTLASAGMPVERACVCEAAGVFVRASAPRRGAFMAGGCRASTPTWGHTPHTHGQLRHHPPSMAPMLLARSSGAPAAAAPAPAPAPV
jgi:hypothetical protein